MMSFKTFSLPCFNELHNIFYPLGKKVVPLDTNSLLTPLGLCYWLSDDATFDKTNSVVVICTDSFSLEEVELRGRRPRLRLKPPTKLAESKL